MLMNPQGTERISHQIFWIWFITNEEHMINDTYQPGLGLSDHVCLSFNYSCYAERYNRPTPRFNLCHADFDQLNVIHSVDWEEVL